MATKILVVEDDDLLRTLLTEMLTEQGYAVDSTGDGESATKHLSFKECDLVISDVRMPKLDGVGLLHWIKRTKPNLKVILMTGFSALLETKEAFALGASDFIPKPFEKADLLKSITQIFGPNSPQATDDSDTPISADSDGPASDTAQDFVRLSLDDFVSGKTMPYSIYVRLGDAKFVKIAHSGQDIDLERLKAYREKNVAHFYLSREDFRKYLSQTMLIVDRIQGAKAISPEKKQRFLKHAGEVLMEGLKIDGVNKENFTEARSFVGGVIETMSDREDMVSLIEMLNDNSDFMYAHSLGVALYSVMICHQMGWTSSHTTTTVMLCGLFHDIGFKELDDEIVNMPRARLTRLQRAAYETHCQRGSEILTSITGIPLEVAQVANQHHENLLGTGYPRYLKLAEISPLSMLVSVADIFCEYTIKNPSRPVGLSAQEALRTMEELHRDSMNLTFFSVLKKAIEGEAVPTQPKSAPPKLQGK